MQQLLNECEALVQNARVSAALFTSINQRRCWGVCMDNALLSESTDNKGAERVQLVFKKSLSSWR